MCAFARPFSFSANVTIVAVFGASKPVASTSQEILHVSSNPADTNKPILEWEEPVLDATLRALDKHNNKKA
jgi:hypothetical protein